MGNIKQWLGPLPAGWMESHRVLQQRILQASPGRVVASHHRSFTLHQIH